mmetsp:Transcript_18859/g.46725  ORF Transcript_18859/g.46725 Transcript_18859/m.46725 type:complete len:207 (+) Transcript_18859:228-848(+)
MRKAFSTSPSRFVWQNATSMNQSSLRQFIDKDFLRSVFESGSLDSKDEFILLFGAVSAIFCFLHKVRVCFGHICSHSGVVDKVAQYIRRSVDLFHGPLESLRLGRTNVIAIVNLQVGSLVGWHSHARLRLVFVFSLDIVWVDAGRLIFHDFHQIHSREPSTREKLHDGNSLGIHFVQDWFPVVIPLFIALHGNQILVRVDKGHPFG